MFENHVFDAIKLPMKGKRKPNDYQKRRGNQAFKRHILEREADYPAFIKEFGHIEGDTILGGRPPQNCGDHAG